MKDSIFKAYDIRGVYSEDFSKEDFYKISKGYATFLIEKHPEKNLKVVVGRDMRISSPELTKEVIKGLLESGLDVVDIGLASTPTYYFAVAEGGYDGGLQISASHNPKEHNGIKAVLEKAYPITFETVYKRVKEIIENDEFKKLDKEGSLTTDDSVLKKVVDYSLSYDDFSHIKPLKIVADTANAMGGLELKALFEKLPCELIEMNFELDGNFPAHPADPLQEKNLEDLKKRVLAEKADLGIATDGDADRIFFIDEKGNLFDPSIVRGLLAQIVLRNHKGAVIGYDIRPGKITKDMILEGGGVPFVTQVGHAIIKKDSIEKGAVFSGESSGHLFFQSDYGFFEMPLVSTLYILREMSEKNLAISEIIKPFQKYFASGEINFEIQDKKGAIEKVLETYKAGAKEVNDLDGITIEHEDYWLNVRASNTEPLLRLSLEAVSKEKMIEKRDELSAFIISLGAHLADH